MLNESAVAEAPVVRRGLAWTSLMLGIVGVISFGLGGEGRSLGF